ncbi:ATP-dependent Clp protease ATP-binding subunit CLPT2, chloroplastic-like protein [Drosera capensis]
MAAHYLSTLPSTISLSQSTLLSPSVSPFLHVPLSFLKLENSCLGARTNPKPTRLCSFTVRSSLSPSTANKERVSNGQKKERVSDRQVPKWSSSAIQAYSRADVETRKLRFEEIGTEGLLLSIILEGTSLASRFLRGHGVTHTKAVKEAKKILGDISFSDCTIRLRIPVTVEVQKALDWAVNEKLKAGGSGMITTSDLLLGIWFSEESPGHTILVKLGFDAEKAEQLKYLSSQPGFDEWREYWEEKLQKKKRKKKYSNAMRGETRLITQMDTVVGDATDSMGNRGR